MEGLKKVPFKDIYLGFYDGPHATPKESDNGAVFLGIKNVTEDGRLDLSDIRFIAENDLPKWTKRVTPKEGDIVFSYEATLHRYAIIPKGFRGCLGRRMALVRTNPNIVDNRFVLYYMLSPLWRKEVERNILTGATVDRIPLTNVPSFRFQLPPLLTQRRIASILSAYDDLIENNLRRIKLLEELAHRTYEEWFVRYRFPGHETAVFDAETGLPKGWERKRADSLFNIKIGKTPPRNEPEWFTSSAKGVKWASIKDINNASVFMSETAEGVTESAVKKFNMNLANEGTVILSFKLTLGKVTIVTEDMVTNEAIAHFSFQEHSVFKKSYVYCYLKAFNYDTLGSTSSIGTAINSKIVKALPFLVPEKEVLNSFQELIEPVFDELKNLLAQNLLLKQSRDILLPKLMSGQLSLEGGG